MSRFASFTRAAAIGVLIALVALIALGAPFSAGKLAMQPSPDSGDLRLYKAIIGRVRAGQPYDAAAIAEQRLDRYPVRPFVTVRPPALAIALSWLPNVKVSDWLIAVLAGGVILAWTLRLRHLRAGPPWTIGVAVIVFTGVSVTMEGANIGVLHEAWAGLLIALSLALRTDKRFAAAAVVGFTAALVRELAIPYLVVMAVVALVERRKGETMAFAGALALTLAALAWHAHQVMALTTHHDLGSPGWLKFSGWPFVMGMEQWNLLVVPQSAAAFVPLALLGAAGWKDADGVRLFILLAGYIVGFMLVGQPTSLYWGFMIAPLLGVGLCLSPFALIDLVRLSTGFRHRPA